MIYFLIFLAGYLTKVSIDEADKYVETKAVNECREETDGKGFWLVDPCSDGIRSISALEETLKILNTQPNLYMSIEK